MKILYVFLIVSSAFTSSFQQGRRGRSPIKRSETQLHEMNRPILDRLASFVFKLENDRVANSSVTDSKGRTGEPIEWAEGNSFANKFSELVASNDLGYTFKQSVADLIAGEYDEDSTKNSIIDFTSSNPVAMYSFTTCPFCRKAKDYLDENSIPYTTIELDLLPDNEGNEIRAQLGRLTRRTSVPSIFIGGEYIGGCNDGPGLLPMAKENGGEALREMLKNAGVSLG
eukprot:g1414.t1 g1414   contig10:2042317-2042997(-)